MDTIAQQEQRAPRIIIVDDDNLFRAFVKEALLTEGYDITEFDPVSSDFSILQEEFDVAVLDLVMPRTNGFEIRKEILKYSEGTQFIIITAYPDKSKLEMSMNLGIYTFLPKPLCADHIRYAVHGAVMTKEVQQRSRAYDLRFNTDGMGLVGKSSHIQDIKRQIGEIAPLEIPVLITGESGVGKEIVANCIHRYSQRASKSCIAVNCAGLTPSLIESELFGHVQGAFTGATKTKHGFFEAADYGTLFLDEIGDLPIQIQSKFLRVLDTGEFARVGETKMRKANVRILSATNQNLVTMVEESLFRQDLFYRLRGAEIKLLPLRKRKEDIPLLVAHFLQDEYTVTVGAMQQLQHFDWPGNVRELSMVVASLKSVVQAKKKIITEESVEKIIGKKTTVSETENRLLSYQDAKREVLENFERCYFKDLLHVSGGNLSKAARSAGMHRKNLRDRLKLLGIYKSCKEIVSV